MNIIELAKECGVHEYGPLTRNWSFELSQLERFSALVRAEYETPLKLSLEALESVIVVKDISVRNKALAAIREALADHSGGSNEMVYSKPSVFDGVCCGCSKKAADGWALYCVECWEKSNGDPFAASGKPMAEQEKQEPVAIGNEWKPCMKLPIIVHVRERREGETHVSTREGITPILPTDLIMRGVAGEEYPIGYELFNKTYTFEIADPVDAKAILEMRDKAFQSYVDQAKADRELSVLQARMEALEEAKKACDEICQKAIDSRYTVKGETFIDGFGDGACACAAAIRGLK